MCNCIASGLLLLPAAAAFSPSSQAADLNGAWGSDASVCSKAFAKNNAR